MPLSTAGEPAIATPPLEVFGAQGGIAGRLADVAHAAGQVAALGQLECAVDGLAQCRSAVVQFMHQQAIIGGQSRYWQYSWFQKPQPGNFVHKGLHINAGAFEVYIEALHQARPVSSSERSSASSSHA